MRKSIVSFAVIASVLFAGASATADTIIMKNGDEKLKVTIVEEGLATVSFKKTGSRLDQAPSEDVKEVRFHSNSNDFKTAAKAFSEKDYYNAAELFLVSADSLSDKKKALKAYCYYRAAYCSQLCTDWDKAISGYTYFANNYANHRLYPYSLRARAECMRYRGSMKNAKEAFEFLQKQVAKKNIGGFWKYEAKYWICLMKESRISLAMKDYEALFADTKDKFPEVASKVRVRMGRIMIEQGKLKEAVECFNEAIKNKKDLDRAVLAGAYLGRGLQIMRRTEASPELYKDALFDLLRVVLSFEDVIVCQPEAMYWAAKCFQKIGGPNASKNSRGLFNRVKTEWPNSLYAQKATEEL